MRVIKRETQNFPHPFNSKESDLILTVEYDERNKDYEIISAEVYNHTHNVTTDITAILFELHDEAAVALFNDVDWHALAAEEMYERNSYYKSHI